MTSVYLIHIEPAYRHARHYVGYTTEPDVEDRLARHAAGSGAVLCRAAVKAGCALVLARVWSPVPRKFELRLKGRSVVPLCPFCSGVAAFNRYPKNNYDLGIYLRRLNAVATVAGVSHKGVATCPNG